MESRQYLVDHFVFRQRVIEKVLVAVGTQSPGNADCGAKNALVSCQLQEAFVLSIYILERLNAARC